MNIIRDTNAIEAMADVLGRGGIALLPTDTIYGLHAVAANETAVARVAEIKGRGDEKPFVIIAASVEQLRTFGADVPAVLEKLWPAPLTAVLQRGKTTIAVRIPDLPWLRKLLALTGPLVSTSANRAGEPPISAIGELANTVAGRVDLALDAGPRDAKPSTIVDFTGPTPRIVREGDPVFSQNLRKTLRISL